MKLNFDLLLASALFAVSLYVSAETETTCTRNSDGTIIAGASGVLVTDTDGNTGSGKKCWTIASTTAYAGKRSGVVDANSDTPAMDCGDTPAPAYTYEIYDSHGHGGDDAVFTGEDDGGGFEMDSGLMNAKLLKSDLTPATSFQNAERMLVGIKLKTPKTVDANTTGFEIRFKMTDSVSVDLAYVENTSRIYATKIGADPFQIDLIVK